MKYTTPSQLKKLGYIFYPEVDDWVIWEDKTIEDKDGGWGWGVIEGIGISNKNYIASSQFMFAGGWEIQYDTIEDIEEV